MVSKTEGAVRPRDRGQSYTFFSSFLLAQLLKRHPALERGAGDPSELAQNTHSQQIFSTKIYYLEGQVGAVCVCLEGTKEDWAKADYKQQVCPHPRN